MPEPIEKTAARNMFYDEQGKHACTKKEILDKKGNVRKGCKIIRKGEIYERNIFTAKNKLFKQDVFVDEVKHFYTDLIHTLVKDAKEKLHVFDKNGLYLATNEDKKYLQNIFGRTTRKRNKYGQITNTVCAGTVKLTGRLSAAWRKQRYDR